jgi:MFS superfamily sulfate permease-like transporter
MSGLDRETILRDVVASIVVFLVALPLCMGIAIASNVPPALGLITGIVGGLIVGTFSGSPLQVSGPAAGLTVLVAEFVNKFGVESLGAALMFGGALQFLAGRLRYGQWFRAMSPAVIYGMLAGIGALILGSQFHVMLDDAPRGSGIKNLISIPTAIIHGIFPIDGSPHELAATLGLGTIIVLVLWNRWRPRALNLIPGALVGVVAATAVAALLKLPVRYVNVPSNLLEAMRFPDASDLSRFANPELLFSGFMLAFIASAETLLCASAVDRMHSGPRTNYDRELAAQGVGNFLCGVLGALPMTGVIVRSSVNVQAGARTRLSAILHGLWLLLFVVAAPGALRLVPICSLAAVLVYTGYKLIDIQAFQSVQRYGRFPAFIYLATFAGIIVTDLLTGVLIGIALTVIKVVYTVSHLRIRTEAEPQGRRVHMHLEGAATFLSLPKLANALESLSPNTELHLHFDRLVYIDHACLDLLSNWERQAGSRGCSLVIEWNGLYARYHRPGVGGAEAQSADGRTELGSEKVSEAVNRS